MKRRRFSAAVTAAVAAVAVLTLTACEGTLLNPGSFTVGIKFDQPGLGLRSHGTYSGLDVDVARYVAAQLGHKDDLRFVQAPTPQRETLLATGQVDMIVGTYSITPARRAKVSFAGPYFVAGQDLLVRTGDDTITGPASMQGRTLCSVTGSTSASRVKDRYPGVHLQTYDTYSRCVDALVAGEVDAVTTDNAILAGYAAQPAYRGKVRLLGHPFSVERYGIGIAKGDVDLCRRIDAALRQMVSTGAWRRAVEANLGQDGFTLVTAENPPKLDPCT